MYVNCTRIPATRDYVLLARASLHGEVLRLKECNKSASVTDIS